MPQKPIRRLIWDIEVSPNIVLAFAAGYDKVINHDAIIHERKVICIGYKWEGEKEIYCPTWDKDQDDKKLLKDFLAVANSADELVAHHGDRFDAPWFRGRCLIHGFEPLPKYKTIDTKAWSSKNFLFNSNKLDYLAAVFGFGHKDKMEFDDWKKILMQKDPVALRKMVTYCRRDVALLERVYKRFAPYLKPKTHAAVLNGGNRWECPRCASSDQIKSKTLVSAAGTVSHQMRCKSCGGYHTINNAAFKEYQSA